MHPAASEHRRAAAGFTLIEMIVGLTVLGILAMVMIPLLSMPTTAYLQAQTRTETLSQAALIRSKLEDDLAQAVPGSLRRVQAGNVSYLEFMQMRAYGRYRKASGGSACPAACSGDGFQAACVESCFTTLGPMEPSTAVPQLNADQVVIFPQSTAPNPYAATRRSVLTAYGSPTATTRQLGFVARNFPQASGWDRFYVVSQPVSYVCNENTGQLQRRWGYAIQAAQPTAFGAGVNTALLSNRIFDCDFQVRHTNQGSVLVARVTLRRALAGLPAEPIQEWMQIAVREE